MKVLTKTIGKFIAYSIYSVTGIFFQELGILGSTMVRAILSLLWIRNFAYLLFDLKIDLSWIEFLIPSMIAIFVCSEWSIAHRENVPEISWIVRLVTVVSSLALTIHLIICIKLLMLYGSNFFDCFLLFWPNFACILTNFKYLSTLSFPRYHTRMNLMLDTCFTYIISSALINCLLLRKGATVLILAELSSSALIMIVSVSKLAHHIMLEIRVQFTFQRLTHREIMDLADDDLCAVCLEKHSSQSCRLLCSHIVHANCLISILQSRRPGQESQCPVCRAPIFGNYPPRGTNSSTRTSEGNANATSANTATAPISEIVPTSTIPNASVAPPTVNSSARSMEEIRRSRPLLIDRIPWHGQTIYIGEPPDRAPNITSSTTIVQPILSSDGADEVNLAPSQDADISSFDVDNANDVEYLSCLLSDDDEELLAEELLVQVDRKRSASCLDDGEGDQQPSPNKRLAAEEPTLASTSEVLNDT